MTIGYRERELNLLSTMRVAIVTLAASVATWAGSSGPVIAREGSQTAIELTQATDLRNLLEHVCARTDMQCEISPDAASIIVPAIRISGVLPEVVSKLMEGTNLNYIIVAASASQPARLIVTAQSTAPTSLPPNTTSPLRSSLGEFENNGDLKAIVGVKNGESTARPVASESSSLSGTGLGASRPLGGGVTASATSSAQAGPTAEQIQMSEDAIRRMYAPPRYPRGAVVLPTDEVGNRNNVPSR